MTNPTQYQPIRSPRPYRVGDDGSVWSKRSDSTDHWRQLACRMIAGRLVVQLETAEGRRQAVVAELVLRAFAGEPEAKEKPIHANGLADDCRLENLSWGLRQNRPAVDPVTEWELADLGPEGIATVLDKHLNWGYSKITIGDDMEIEYATVQAIIDTHGIPKDSG